MAIAPQTGASVLQAPLPELVVLTPPAPVAELTALFTLLAKLVASLFTLLSTLLALLIAASILLLAAPVAVAASELKLATTLEASAKPVETADPTREVTLWKNELPSEMPVEMAPPASLVREPAKEVAVDKAPAPSEVKVLNAPEASERPVETTPPTREVTELKMLSN